MYKAICLTTEETHVWNHGGKEEFTRLYQQVCAMGAPECALLGKDDLNEPLYDLDWHTQEDLEEEG